MMIFQVLPVVVYAGVLVTGVVVAGVNEKWLRANRIADDSIRLVKESDTRVTFLLTGSYLCVGIWRQYSKDKGPACVVRLSMWIPLISHCRRTNVISAVHFSRSFLSLSKASFY